MTRSASPRTDSADTFDRIAVAAERIAAALEQLTKGRGNAVAEVEARPVVALARPRRPRRAPQKRAHVPENLPSELDRARAREMLAKHGLLEKKR